MCILMKPKPFKLFHAIDIMKIEAKIEPIASALDELSIFARNNGFSADQILKIQLVLEEILVNIVHHAYQSTDEYIELEYNGIDDGSILITISDRGVAFDPLGNNLGKLEGHIADARVGGLGIYLVKEIAQDVNYERVDGKNILTLIIGKQNGTDS